MLRHLSIIVASVLLSATPAMAHPGHGAVQHQQGLMHYLTSPLHLGGGIACLLMAALTAALLLRSLRQVRSLREVRSLRRVRSVREERPLLPRGPERQ